MFKNEFENIKDFKYFAEKYLDVSLYNHQKELSSVYDDNNFILLKKSRQLGSTSFIIWKIAHLVATQKDKTIVYFGYNSNICEHVNKQIIEFADILEIGDGIREKNKDNIYFNNGMRIKFVSKTDRILSYGINYMFIEEADLRSDFKKIYTDFLPCISSRNSKILITTSNYEYSENKEFFKELENRTKKIVWNWYNASPKTIEYIIDFRKTFGLQAFLKEYEMGD